jgi:glycosyltransferase involved in cell wall biosynthesis
VDIVPNALNVSTFAPEQVSASDVELPDKLDDSFILLFVHGLCEQKGTPYLVEAFEQFQRDVGDASLVLVGSDDLDDMALRKRIRANSDIHHIQHVPHSEIRDLYNFADLFVLPSVTVWYNEEQFGIALLEAMACATPSVVTNVGGLPHVAQHGETSLVVDERSPTALTDAFESLYQDHKKRERFGRNSRRYVKEHYSIEVVADQLREFYTETVDIPL